MRIEVTYKGVAKNRVYYATPVTQGRPRKTAEIVKSRKPFATGSTKDEAVKNLLSEIGFVPHNAKA
jgi:hypothetical protein